MRPLQLVHKIDNVIIYREPGGNSWSGRGETKYYPPCLYAGIDKDDMYNIVAIITYTKQYLQRAKKEALEIMEQLLNKKGEKKWRLKFM